MSPRTPQSFEKIQTGDRLNLQVPQSPLPQLHGTGLPRSHSRSHSHTSSFRHDDSANWTTLIPPMPSYPPAVQTTPKRADLPLNRHSIASASPNAPPFSPQIIGSGEPLVPGSFPVSPSRQSSRQPYRNSPTLLQPQPASHPQLQVNQSSNPPTLSSTQPSHQQQPNPQDESQFNFQPSYFPPQQFGLQARDISNASKGSAPVSNSSQTRKKRKVCHVCQQEITGQFVRALSHAYHVQCFTCSECGNQCASKFFPYESTDAAGNKIQVPLCEYDYFKKLDLLCFNCNKALRGPYITALGNKYHLEHFKCVVCQRVFESDESYYEHAGSIYCHYHFSKTYASHCEGCNSSIVKQFVELYRGGRNQQWHPECYMVHKFWNVCITADSVGLEKVHNIPRNELRNLKESNMLQGSLLTIENEIETTVMTCWLTLSGYEEATAAAISDMLLNACTGNQGGGLLATGKLIVYLGVLFGAIDSVQGMCDSIDNDLMEETMVSDLEAPVKSPFQTLKREPRNISGKIMSYLALLRKSKQLAESGPMSTEILSVITGCAHYLKLLIRVGLSNSLKVNEIRGTAAATNTFFTKTKLYEEFAIVEADSIKTNVEAIEKRLSVAPNATDACTGCHKSIEKACVRYNTHRWHLSCFDCSTCNNSLVDDVKSATYKDGKIFCAKCAPSDSLPGFERVTNLSQLIYLLKIALSRSKAIMSVDEQDPPTQTEMATIAEERAVRNAAEQDYSRTLRDVTRLRTSRQSQKLSNSLKQKARKSVILETPDADEAKEEMQVGEVPDEELKGGARKSSFSSQLSFVTQQVESDHFNVTRKKSLRIRDEPQRSLTNSHLDRTSDLLKNEKSLTLDDIPRIVAAEQAREQRPNAYRHHNSIYEKQKPMNSVRTASVGALQGLPAQSKSTEVSEPVQKSKYYSELSKSEHFILRHVAIEALVQLLNNKYNKEELLALIQTRKAPTFWEKLKLGGGEKKEKNSSIFGVDLQDLTKKYGVDSDLGVGPAQLRIPIVVDDIITAMRQKDMSVEGIFRLNGNIKRLKELTDQINKHPLKSPDFASQSAVQLAALMKKWIRELPNPLLTYNLHDLWIQSQREPDLVLRKRLLQLTYCMLPRSHRNLLEVLLYFFSWVASFAEIDEETGSKMDIHNLATVISPNILVSRQSQQSDPSAPGETYFLAIEVVNQLIEQHEEMSIIPDDLWQFFGKSDIASKPNLTTKEVMARLDKVSKENPGFFKNFSVLVSQRMTYSNLEVRSNTVSRGHSKAMPELHGETTAV